MKILWIVFCCLPLLTFGQYDRYIEFWSENDAEFSNPEKSPLKPEAITSFDSIARFAYDSTFAIWAAYRPFKRQKPFTFETTGDIKQRYQKVAEMDFVIDEDTLTLSGYRNLALMRNPDYRDRLFIPFTDESNGFGTYEGGRYLEADIPEADSLFLDFNLAYNPYCAYSDRYSCPIPPRENDLKKAIKAGAKSPE
jgi:hypothetical protein